MRYTTLLPLAAAVTQAFVIPNEVIAQQLALDPEPAHDEWSWWDSIPSLDDLRSSAEDTFSSALDAVDAGSKSLLDSLPEFDFEVPDFLSSSLEREHPGKGRKGHHGHRGHHGPSNLTIYQAIQFSKYSTKFAKLVDEYPDIVKALNSTKHNITAFVPTDKAFDKIPEHHKKPSKEFIEKVIEYHLVPGLYPAGRILASHTLPTAVKEDALGGKPQRLRVSIGLFGLRVNFYSKVVVANIFVKNGVIHGVDSILVPPPPAPRIISLFPQKFSTLLLAGEKTGLGKELHGLRSTGGTLFAPTNWAFEKLGPGANAFLFNTEKGLGYLKALLKYHTVVNETLYSDAYYGKEGSDDINTESSQNHIDLPTLLEDKNLSIDIARWGGFITFKINGFTRVSIQDAIAKDGVIQVLSSVLIPPHEHHGQYVDGQHIEVEELIERLEPFLENKKEHLTVGEL
ncbi:putative Fasciclin domain-containing protein [Seiridium cardinale]|uniref:Fasciclin domain-containing protein n=1 Tax=Seiridium cardinale TaxID=138064 RepID=A0ABR2XI54_9PEZI